MIEQVAVGGFDKNFSYIIHDGEQAAVVDPSGDVETIFAALKEKGAEPVAVLITHSHFDHVEKLLDFLAEYPVPVYLHEDARARVSVPEGTEVRTIADGDTVHIGDIDVQVLHTPGHISDAVCFLVPAEHTKDGAPELVSGDTLFVEGCGRVKSEHDAEVLYESLQRLKALPDDTRVYPGHDYGSKPVSTIGWEKEHNRFFLASDLAGFKRERL